MFAAGGEALTESTQGFGQDAPLGHPQRHLRAVLRFDLAQNGLDLLAACGGELYREQVVESAVMNN